MKKNIFLKLVGLAIIALFIGSLLPASSMAAPIKLNYANFPPAPTFPCVQMERWKKEVEKRTGGKVAIKTFPGGTLLGAKNMMDGVIAGTADIGCLCMAYQPGRFLVTNATALPVGFPNATVASLALWDIYNKYKPKAFAKVKVLTMFTCAPANIYAKKAVKNLEDLKGLELRASGGVAQALKALGATPVGMPQSATPEALQKGVVQGAASSLETLMDFKYAEICKYVTIFNGPVYPFAVVMNVDKWNSLPKDVQKVMDGMGVEQAFWTGNYMDKHVDKSVEWSKKNHNIEITKLTKKELANWNRLLRPLKDQWITKAKAKGLPARAILRDIRVAKEYHTRF
ncbi:MAG: C4-dicarboxylate ABC transporter substrate-binding protein [Deltaproteobacteria bacterium]|nr:TRAP transporter substrate-binding protein [Deltaproteobacteria bacterium]MCD6265977.1 TRAP transporter substrate-binding protein [Deltaproteobacteria bacterium]RLB18474.1 MAG: C4-dicarboxylate ABC transporter substrate-binding protein [Deltaproteobacteria bacterium]RLB20686.1 MAG: C4-dicarboxylate ABC transporter substrate-binding protein [Deltaproteobacteria bacterium]HDH86530.1 TRAP transporter substrate-binding protein [Desulfobacteraceae bacterium]